MTLSQIEAAVDQLDLADQIRLLQLLTCRVTNRMLAAIEPQTTPQANNPVACTCGDDPRLDSATIDDASSIADELARSRG